MIDNIKISFSFLCISANKRIKTLTSQQLLKLIERGDVAVDLSFCCLHSKNCFCVYLCMVAQQYRCSSVSFIKLTAFFLLSKITFIISVSNTYWPRVNLWHIPAAHNHGCLHLSISHDLLTPFLFTAFQCC